ncbi:MAG: CoA-binding protein [Deltaproteobacteria bacterium]|nr:CoA-binding protein [Deltaproteobacteria bacterium]
MDNKKLQNMRYLFNPSNVAVVGASQNPGKLGFHVMKSLTQGGYNGEIIPINPSAQEIMGQCANKGIKGIVLITAGFKEIEDPLGAELHEQIRNIAEDAHTPVIGPNTFGMINFHAGLNSSFTPEFSRIRKGKVALVSQSGGERTWASAKLLALAIA